MRKHCTALALLVGFVLMTLAGQGQKVKHFIGDSIIFLEQVTTLLNDGATTDQKKEAKDFLELFEPVWYSGKLNMEQRLQIYKTGNLMLKKDITSHTDFYNYLYSLMNCITSNQSKESFESWQESLEKLLEGRNKSHYTEYLIMSKFLFSDNTFYSSASARWRSRNNDYEFVYDSVPKVVFKKLDLICSSKEDSAIIYNTSGVFYPSLGIFRGEGGKVTWVRGGLSENETFALIPTYEFKVKSAGFVIDSVKFYNPFFDHPLDGRLTEKVLANVTPENASYPRFESYSQRLYIRDIVKNVDFEGGFTMKGSKLIGSGVGEELSTLTFYRNDTAFLRASSLSFTIQPDRIAALESKIVIFLGNDSITHPGLNFKFMRDKRELTLYRPDEGFSKSPYFNTYHNFDMFVEQIVWNIDEPLMTFKSLMATNETAKTAIFESASYFEQSRYDIIQKMDVMNPLVYLRDVSKKLNSNTFSADDVAREMKMPFSTIQNLLLNLAVEGFILYNNETRVITLKDKVHDWVLNSAKKKDYDIIRIKSVPGGSVNATLNLLNNDLRMEGVKHVDISKVQHVSFEPDSGRMVIKQNRYFTFGGVVNAGKIYLHGKEFEFDYEPFKFHLNNVDSLRMKVNDLDALPDDKNPIQRHVTTVIEGITRGELMVDNPYNKSGVLKDEKDKDYGKYPFIDIPDHSFVYWDDNSIHNGAYKRENFFFDLDPFVMDSLDNYSNSGLAFPGRFVSGKIFPEFRETLSLQDDYSLGFTRAAPEGGFPLYEGRARFDNNISMNNDGLTGSGNLEYITSISRSSKFTFLPDSTVGKAQTFDNTARAEGVQMPDAHGTEVKISYLPYQEVLRAIKEVDESLLGSDPKIAATRRKYQAINMFDAQVFLSGGLELRPTGMEGFGRIDFETAIMTADNYKFNKDDFRTDHGSFALKAQGMAQDVAFSTNDINAFVDLKNRIGKFRSNKGLTRVEFPVNEYYAMMNHFDWHMDENDIELSASESESDYIRPEDMDILASNFYSTQQDQDSLNFNAGKAKYDLDSYTIFAKQVNHILVADARISPDSGNVVIRAKAKMDPLSNARILCNNITRYHLITGANVNIKARRSYFASGNYEYVDENKRKQNVYFSNIKVDTSYQTMASGNIQESDEFTLSPNFEYFGEVRLEANKQFLTFVGSTRIAHNCAGIERNWMDFQSEINPNEIYVPVAEYHNNPDSLLITAGLVLNNVQRDSVYATFLSRKRALEHGWLTPVEGFLYFDKKSQQYQIASKDKLRDRLAPGNFISMHKDVCKVYAEGSLNFGTEFNQVKVRPIGEMTMDPTSQKVEYVGAMAVNFPFAEAALDKMVTNIKAYKEFEPAEIAEQYYGRALREVVGTETTDELITSLRNTGALAKKPPDALISNLFFSELKLKWNPDANAWRSSGEFGIATIDKASIFKKFDGYVELKKNRATVGDILTIYIEIDPNNWYFFSYARGIMQVLSSDSEFNDAITAVDEDKRKFKSEVKEDGLYTYTLSTKRIVTDFIKKFDR